MDPKEKATASNGHVLEKLDTPAFDLLGTFLDRDEEARFRAERLPTAVTQFQQICWVLTVGIALFTINDIRLASGGQLAVLLAVRFGIILFALNIAFYAKRVESVSALDRLGLTLSIPFVLVVLWQDYARPREYFVHIGADVAIILGIYVALPVSQRSRVAVALTLSAGLVWMFGFYKTATDTLSVVSSILSIAIANGLGLFVLVRLAKSIRGEYALSKREHCARVELEKALSKVKTLSGFIPICAGCKKVRNDAGFWQQVEVYVRDHSEAQFSHSICPECMIQYERELVD